MFPSKRVSTVFNSSLGRSSQMLCEATAVLIALPTGIATQFRRHPLALAFQEGAFTCSPIASFGTQLPVRGCLVLVGVVLQGFLIGRSIAKVRADVGPPTH